MDEFNKGWWNCLLSYTDTISFRSDAQDLAIDQMSSAGVEVGEINYVLKNRLIMNETTRGILMTYKELKIKKSKSKNEH